MPENKANNNVFLLIVAVQFICVFILITGAFAVKLVSKNNYKRISAFYSTVLCRDTNAQKLLSAADNEI